MPRLCRNQPAATVGETPVMTAASFGGQALGDGRPEASPVLSTRDRWPTWRLHSSSECPIWPSPRSSRHRISFHRCCEDPLNPVYSAADRADQTESDETDG